MKALVGLIIASVLVTGAVAQVDMYGPASSGSNSGVSSVLSEGKALVKKGNAGYNEVLGGGNNRHVKDFVGGKGVAEMIK